MLVDEAVAESEATDGRSPGGASRRRPPTDEEFAAGCLDTRGMSSAELGALLSADAERAGFAFSSSPS